MDGTLETNAEQINKWFYSSEPGSVVTYKIGPVCGYYIGQRYVSSGVIAIRDLYDRGLVDLYQRRVTAKGFKRNDSEFAYIAVKRGKACDVPYEHSFDSYNLKSRGLVVEVPDQVCAS